jgi:hypothetical protein
VLESLEKEKLKNDEVSLFSNKEPLLSVFIQTTERLNELLYIDIPFGKKES